METQNTSRLSRPLNKKIITLWQSRYRIDSQTAMTIIVLFVASVIAVAVNQKIQSNRQSLILTHRLFDPYDLREPTERSRASEKLILGY